MCKSCLSHGLFSLMWSFKSLELDPKGFASAMVKPSSSKKEWRKNPSFSRSEPLDQILEIYLQVTEIQNLAVVS